MAAKKAVPRNAVAEHYHSGTGSNNPDPKPQIKQFIPSPNYSSRNGALINMVVLHCTEGSLTSTIKTFKDSGGRQVSAHYIIDRNGDIYQMVDDDKRANHCKGANSNSIGIEHVATMTQPLAAAQSAASAALVRWLLQQYDIPAARVFGHDFAPGYSGGGTSCPDALFGAHSQEAVSDWVNRFAVAKPEEALARVVGQPIPGSKLVVNANSLNVRVTPSLQGSIIGALLSGEEVDWLETSQDEYWARVRSSTLSGWVSRRFVLPPTSPALPVASASLDIIVDIASVSAIARYSWLNRGVAPLGYIKGMARVYARLYCKLRAGDVAAREMSRAVSWDGSTDALAHYARQFSEVGMDNEASGVSTLRHLFVLMIGLGMRESAGRYCEGRDRNAANTTAVTAEAGLFQTSYNVVSANGLLTQLFEQYMAAYEVDPSIGFADTFKEGVTCGPQDWHNFGTGAGRNFQDLTKKCPAFAAEICAIGLRSRRKHWGPINRMEVEIRPEANQLLMRIEQAMETHSLCAV